VLVFFYDKVGAQARANLFSLTLTCRAHDVDRFEYFSYIFEDLPLATTLEALDALLPCRMECEIHTEEGAQKKREEALRAAVAI